MLPVGEVADGDVGLKPRLYAYDGSGFSQSQNITIPDNENQAAYNINHMLSEGTEVVFVVVCETNCEQADGGFSTLLYLQDDGVTLSNNFNSLPIENINEPQDLQYPPLPLVRTQRLTIGLHEWQSADGDIDILVNLEDGNQNTLYRRTITNPDQSAFSSFTFEFPVPDTATVRLSFRCITNCEQAVGDFNSTFYLQNDGSISSKPSSIFIDNLNNPQDLQFPPIEVASLSGTIYLPMGQVADDNMNISVTFLDANSRFNVTQTVTIPAGENKIDYNLDYPVPSSGTEVRLSFRCDTSNPSCERADGDLHTLFSLQDDGSVSGGNNFVSIDNLDDTQDLHFPPINISTLSGTVSLPEGLVADGDIEIGITFREDDFDLINILTVTIPNMSNQADFSFNYPEPSPGTQVFLLIECFDSSVNNCDAADGGQEVAYYLQDDGRLSNSFNTLAIEDLNSQQDLQFPLTSFHSDLYEVDNTAAESSSINANQQQSRTIHEPGDVDWVSFEVLEGDSNIKISTMTPQHSLSPLEMTVFDSDFVAIETGREFISNAETNNGALLEVSFETLSEGDYFIRIQGISNVTEGVHYSLSLSMLRASDEICIPIKAANGAIAIICF